MSILRIYMNIVCREPNKILLALAITRSDTQLVVQFAFRSATLLQISLTTMRGIGWRYV